MLLSTRLRVGGAHGVSLVTTLASLLALMRAPAASAMRGRGNVTLTPPGLTSVVSALQLIDSESYARRTVANTFKRQDFNSEFFLGNRAVEFGKGPLMGVVAAHYADVAKANKLPMDVPIIFLNYKLSDDPLQLPETVLSLQEPERSDDYYNYSQGSASAKKHCYVDFANRVLGGGVFGRGMVQEEQMFFQMPELLFFTKDKRLRTSPSRSRFGDGWVLDRHGGVLRMANVFATSVWGKDSYELCRSDTRACAEVAAANGAQAYGPFDVFAVDAPAFGRNRQDSVYTEDDFDHLLQKIFALFLAAKEAECDVLHSGPLGAGAFRGNANLVALLQAVFADALKVPLIYHGPDDHLGALRKLAAVKAGADSSDRLLPAVVDYLRECVWGHGDDATSYFLLEAPESDVESVLEAQSDVESLSPRSDSSTAIEEVD